MHDIEPPAVAHIHGREFFLVPMASSPCDRAQDTVATIPDVAVRLERAHGA